MICCAAPSSGGVSIDLSFNPIVGLSREPSFSVFPENEDDTLQLVMQPSRNAPKGNKAQEEPVNPIKMLLEASHSINPISDDTKYSLF